MPHGLLSAALRAALALLLMAFAASAQATNTWELLTAGLPAPNASWSLGATFVRSQDAFVAVHNHPAGSNNNGIYRLAAGDNTWRRFSPPTNQYGTGSCAVSPTNSSIYCLQQGGLYVLNETATDPAARRWIGVPLRLNNVTVKADLLAVGSSRLVMAINTTAPRVYALSLPGGVLTDLAFPWTALDGKPHVLLLEDKAGRVWYVSNYNGTFVHDGGWSQASTRSGALSVANDGTVILSYEVQATTQINTFFVYVPPSASAPAPRVGAWQVIMDEKGYGAGGPAVGASAVVALGGRFPDVLVAAGRKWRLPATWADLGLAAGREIDVRVYGVVATPSGCTYARFEYPGVRRMQRLCVDFSTLPSYSTDTKIQLGTYLAGAGNNSAVDLSWMPAGLLLVAMNAAATVGSSSSDAELQTAPAAGVSRGALLVLAGAGITGSGSGASVSIARTMRFATPLAAVAAQRGGGSYLVAVATRDTLGVVNASSGSWVWQQAAASPPAIRLAFDQSGTLAVLLPNNTVRLVNGLTGAQLADPRVIPGRTYVTDVEVNSAAGLYYVVGFDNRRLPSGSPIQVAFLVAYSLASGAEQWRRFSFDSALLSSNIADTRLYRVSLSADGTSLDLLGESAGSETIFRYDGQRYNGTVSLTVLDFYNDLSNTASAHIAYVAKVEATTGNFMSGQLNMARLSTGKSNTFKLGDISSDASGRTFIGGATASSLPARAAQTVNGVALGTYKGDPAFLALAPRMRARYAWTSLNRDNATGEVAAVAARASRVALLANIREGEAFTTTGALAQTNANLLPGNVYLAVVDVAENGWAA